MNTRENSEIRGLTTDELDRVSGVADTEENIIELRPDQLDHITGASGDRMGNFDVQGLMSDFSAAQKPS